MTDFDPPPVSAVRGFYSWTPYGKNRRLLENIKRILLDYREVLPLTVRQVFYILIGRGEWTKAQGERPVYGVVYRARRARQIPFSAFRDDGWVQSAPGYYDDAALFWSAVRAAAGNFKLDRQQGQAAYLELWCEAAGMVPQLERVAHPFGVPVFSGGGYDSITAKYTTAGRIALREVPTVILTVGDFDAEGRWIIRARFEDIAAFAEELAPTHDEVGNPLSPVAPELEVVAITPDQAHDLPLAAREPLGAKEREKHPWWPVDWKIQAEALDPRALAAAVREAIENRLDLTVYEDVLAKEEQERNSLMDAFPPEREEDSE